MHTPNFQNILRCTGMAVIAAILLGAAIVAPSTGLSACAEESLKEADVPLSWYCAHKKDHIQPEADARFDFVEALGGYYIDHRHTDPSSEDKVVYLTFDAGYENGNVARILDTLREESVSGAFFVLGHLAREYPDLLRRMRDEGHLICNHTFTHKALTGATPDAISDELGRLEQVCHDCTGVAMSKYFRPPEGKFDRSMLESAASLGYKTIFWSFAYADWDNTQQPNPARAKKKILDNVHNGAVMLLHPTSATNAAVLGDVIRELKAQGYRFGTLDELTAVSARDAKGEDHGE